MIICSCNVLSDHDVRDCLGQKLERPSVGAVFRHMGREPQCGRCARSINAIVDQHMEGRAKHCGGAGECDNCPGDLAA